MSQDHFLIQGNGSCPDWFHQVSQEQQRQEQENNTAYFCEVSAHDFLFMAPARLWRERRPNHWLAVTRKTPQLGG